MNKFFKYIFLIFVIFYSNILLASERIFFLDLDYLMNNSSAGKSIINQLDKKNKSNISNFKKIKEDLKNEETKLTAQKNILNNDEFNKKVKLFQKKLSNFRLNQTTAANEIKTKRLEAQKVLINTITPILTDYSDKNSISFIVSKNNIIVGKSELDLTKIILEILNSKVKNIKIK